MSKLEWKKYTFVNGEERREELNDVELAEVVMDIVMSNLRSSFRWNDDQTILETLG